MFTKHNESELHSWVLNIFLGEKYDFLTIFLPLKGVQGKDDQWQSWLSMRQKNFELESSLKSKDASQSEDCQAIRSQRSGPWFSGLREVIGVTEFGHSKV